MRMLQNSLVFFLALSGCTNVTVKKQKSIPEKDLPPKVAEALAKRRTGVSYSYEVQKLGDKKTYEAHFEIEGKKHSERFKKNGELVEMEQDIALESLPEAIRNRITEFLKAEDKDSKTTSVQSVSSEEFKGVEIKVKTKRSRTSLMEYFFNPDGSLHHQEELKLKAIPTLY